MIQYLTNTLERLGLACPLPGELPRYLVPSILPSRQPQTRRPRRPRSLSASCGWSLLRPERMRLCASSRVALGAAADQAAAAPDPQRQHRQSRRPGTSPLQKWARLAFGTQKFELHLDEASTSIRVVILLAFPTPVAQQLKHLAAEVCREWMPELRASVWITTARVVSTR